MTDLSKRETSTLTQTSHALKCCSNDPHAALSDKKIECERVIFMARQKLTSYNSEIKRLENLDPDSEYYSSDISHSTLILQDIRLAIKEDYLRSLRKGKGLLFINETLKSDLFLFRNEVLFFYVRGSLSITNTFFTHGFII